MPMSPRLLRPRATGFNPTNVSGLWAWFDAADQSTMTLNGSTVSEWRSKSGAGGIVLAQGTASAQPTLTQSYYSGRSALTFDGGDFLTDLDSGLPINGTTIAVVWDETTRVAFAGILIGRPAAGDDFSRNDGFRLSLHEGANIPTSIVWRNVGSDIDARAPSASEAAALGRNVVLVTIEPSVSNVGRAVVRYNGNAGTADTSYGAPTGGVTTTTGTLVGARFVGGVVDTAYRFNGRMCEIAVWNRALSSSEIQSVERYLGNRWGVTVP